MPQNAMRECRHVLKLIWQQRTPTIYIRVKFRSSSYLHVSAGHVVFSLVLYLKSVLHLGYNGVSSTFATNARTRDAPAMSLTPSSVTNADRNEELPLRGELSRLQGQASEWTLDQDTKLQKCLQRLSDQVDQRQREVEASLAQFGFDVERARARLANITNEFDALSYTQFMEHRVYDEEEAPAQDTAADLEQPAPSEEEQQAQRIKEYSSLVKHGLEALAAFPLGEDDDFEYQPHGTAQSTRFTGLQYPELVRAWLSILCSGCVAYWVWLERGCGWHAHV